METFLIKAAQLILALAILIIIHEFGHFLFARLFGVKVEKFYIFFNPIRSLFKWKPGKHVGSLSKVKFLSESGERDYRCDEALEKAAGEYQAASAELEKLEHPDKNRSMIDRLNPFGAENREGADPQVIAEARRKVDETKKAYDEQVALKAELDRNGYDEEKRQSRWSRFWKNTEYGVGWVPLGGYCKIAGMIDESMDTEQMKRPAQPWEFRSKPAWQRLLIMIAGVLFNFLLAILIYAGIVYFTGEKYVPVNEAKMGMSFSPVAHEAGFRDGDIPLSADGKTLDNPAEARIEMMQAKSVELLRDGKRVTVTPPSDFMVRLNDEMTEGKSDIAFMTYRFPTRVTQVMAGEGAAKAGIRPMDEIIAINEDATPTLVEFLNTLQWHGGETVNLTVVRPRGAVGDKDVAARPFGVAGDTLSIPVTLNDNAKMGIGLEIDPSNFYDAKEKKYSLFSAVPRGIQMGTERLSNYASSMKIVFSKEGAKSVGGFGALGSIFPERWDWIAFWNIAAFISIALAFMNILPIPALDGGHVLFLLYEVITGRQPSQKFLETAQMIGMMLLIALLLYANMMDIVRLFK